MRYKPRTLEDIIQMKFANTYDEYRRGELTQDEAAGLLHISSRSFRRKIIRYEDEGMEGLLDKRFGNIPPNKIPLDIIDQALRLKSEDYPDYSYRHFHEVLKKDFKYEYGYSSLTTYLRYRGISSPLPKRKKKRHRKKRERRPMEGMMIHQDGSTHNWLYNVAGHQDLIVTMDDATNEIYSIFLTDEEGTNSSFKGIKDTIEKKGIFCDFYTDRGSHYVTTLEAGEATNKSKTTQVGRALKQLGINHILARSPQARGRSERMFGTLQNRLPQELRRLKISNINEANDFIKNDFLPRFNSLFMVKPTSEKSAFIDYIGRDLDDILCIQNKRVVNNDNTISYNNIKLQIPYDGLRYHYVKTDIMVHEYNDGSLAIFHGPRKLANYQKDGDLADSYSVNKIAA